MEEVNSVMRRQLSQLTEQNQRAPGLAMALVAAVLALVAFSAPAALARGVEPRFDLADPAGAPLPSDRFTVADSSQRTGLRVALPKPDCGVAPSDCDDLDVLNALDGFNLQPRLSIPFTGAIDVASVTSETVFVFELGAAHGFVGINQVVWDQDANTLHAESDELLDQHARYLLVVTDGVHDTAGDAVESAQFRKLLNFGQTKAAAEKAYRDRLRAALDALEAAGVPPGRVAAASLFTTQSATAVMEKIRDQLAAATPAPAEFRLGPDGERTVFALADVASIAWRRQDTTAPSFTTVAVPLASLRLVPGVVGTIAFGSYRSPDYQTADGVIPPVGTLTGVPAVQRTSDVYFNLFLPAGPAPAGGWPVVIGGHGGGPGGKNTGNASVAVAAKLAQHGLATIAINAAGFGGGPLGTLTVTKADASTVTLPAGGRSVDRNANGVFDNPGGSLPEGLYTAPDGPRAIVFARDALRQTAVDLMQLVRQIQAGVDVDGDSVPDLDAERVYYVGNSLGGIYGTGFVALDPGVRAAVLNVAGGLLADVLRLNSVGPLRALLGQLLAARVPSLLNGGPDPITAANPFPFRENLPFRNQTPVANNIAGAIRIQEQIERFESAMQAGDPVAYAPHLRKDPLAGVAAKPVLFSIAQGDPTQANPNTTAILRAGELKDRTLYFRGLDAYAPNQPSAVDLHEFPFRFTPIGTPFALATQDAIATFLASDGQTTTDPDGTGPLFEVPITAEQFRKADETLNRTP